MSSDHQDAPAAKAEPTADINDVYTWMDGNNYVAAMTVFPLADATAKFSDSVQYVFHTTSGTMFGDKSSTTNIICTFDAAQVASCWVGTDDYVTGSASAETGMTSASGKTKVFAGLRNDPFFFNLQGFRDAVNAVETAPAGTYTLDSSGCPVFPSDSPVPTALQGLLKETTSTSTTDPGASSKTVADDFVTAKTLILVVSVDKSLVTKGGPILSVWGSTNAAK